MTDEGIKKLLILMAENDCQEDIWWNERLDFFINCNDVFAWGCSDSEDVTEPDIPALEKALEDAGGIWGPLLYCARKCGMRPQGAFMEKIPPGVRPLFDAAGPPREVGLGNPHPHPDDGPAQ